jgi:hypothetical protein
MDNITIEQIIKNAKLYYNSRTETEKEFMDRLLKLGFNNVQSQNKNKEENYLDDLLSYAVTETIFACAELADNIVGEHKRVGKQIIMHFDLPV